MASKKSDIDSMVTYLFLRHLMTPIFQTKAFKLNLVDSAGRVIKEPVTAEEKEALTLLDKIVFKMRRLLGPRVAQLYNFLYLQTLNNNLYNNLIVTGSVGQRAEIRRLSQDINRLKESVNLDMDDIVYDLLTEEFIERIEKEILTEGKVVEGTERTE